MLLDFIWHLRGSVFLDSTIPDKTVLDSLERWLSKQRKPVAKSAASSLTFDHPLWSDPLSPNWLALVIYDHGRFWIEQGDAGRRLRYELRSLHGMVFCLCAAGMFVFFGVAAGGLIGGIEYAVGTFAWLYGMNIVLALVRVPRAIRKTVQPPETQPHVRLL